MNKIVFDIVGWFQNLFISLVSMSDTSSSSFIAPRYEENKLMSRFAVTATCGEAYEGVAQVSMCQEPGEPFRGGEHAGLGGGWTNLFFFDFQPYYLGKWWKNLTHIFWNHKLEVFFFYFEILVRFLRSPYFQKKSEPLVQGWPSIFNSFCAVHNSLWNVKHRDKMYPSTGGVL